MYIGVAKKLFLSMHAVYALAEACTLNLKVSALRKEKYSVSTLTPI